MKTEENLPPIRILWHGKPLQGYDHTVRLMRELGHKEIHERAPLPEFSTCDEILKLVNSSLSPGPDFKP